MPEEEKNNNIQVLSRAAGILRTLAEHTDGMSLGQIANRVELPRSTVQRIVTALAAEGFVSTARGNGGIRLGPQIQSLAQAALIDRSDVYRPTLLQIASETGETVDLAVFERGRMRFIDQIIGRQRLRTVSSIGESFPMSSTANGKAALACLDQGEAARLVLAELEAEGQAERLMTVLNDVEAIRQGDLATDENEHTDGISAMGFAVREASGDVVAISVPVPSSRYNRQRGALADVIKRARDSLI